MRLSMMQQEAERFQEKIGLIDRQIEEMNAVKSSIKDIKQGENKEILTNLGKGIFVKTQIKEKDFLVNVGKDIVVRKTNEEIIEVLEEQLKKLFEGKTEIMNQIENLQKETLELVSKVKEEQDKEKKK